MSAAWVAGGVRARSLARRRLGAGGIRRVAAEPSLADALRGLAGTPYGEHLRPEQTLAEAEFAISRTLLWHLRVLAGWLPRTGVNQVRLLAGWFELANVDELVHRLAGGTADPPFRLGSLGTAWPRLAGAGSLEELRSALATSAWGDPGAATPRAVRLASRLAWAARVAGGVPAAAGWAAGAAALLVANETVPGRRGLPALCRRRAAELLGWSTVDAATLPELAGALSRSAAWVLAGIDRPADLWLAELRWWTRLERDGFALLRRSALDEGTAVGAVAVLAADAWRLRAALETAARGGRAGQVFDAMG